MSASQQARGNFEFEEYLKQHKVAAHAEELDTLQFTMTRRCKRGCSQCYFDCSIDSNDEASAEVVQQLIALLHAQSGITTLELIGGMTELHPLFEHLVREAVKAGKSVRLRHNLTVTVDGDWRTGAGKSHLPAFLAENKVVLLATLPGGFLSGQLLLPWENVEKGIRAIRSLNEAGYAKKGSPLKLDLVHSTAGAFLAHSQEDLERQYRERLGHYGALFNNLRLAVNMPVHRLKERLEELGAEEDYLELLAGGFDPQAAAHALCRNRVAVNLDGAIHDCCFNQIIGRQLREDPGMTVFTFDYERLKKRAIAFGPHCFGCAAQRGSECVGQIACRSSLIV